MSNGALAPAIVSGIADQVNNQKVQSSFSGGQGAAARVIDRMRAECSRGSSVEEIESQQRRIRVPPAQITHA
jgi:hypothetical protein